MFGDKRENTRGGEEIKHSEGADTAQELVGRAVEGIISEYELRRKDYQTSVADRVVVKLSAPILTEQKEQLPATDRARFFASDILLEVVQSHSPIKDISKIDTILCHYMFGSQRKEQDCFFAREILERHDSERTWCDVSTGDLRVLAKHLTRLREDRSALREDIDDNKLLADVAKLTKDPTLWLAVLDNILECKTIGSKKDFALKVLAENLSTVQSDPAVAEKLELLARSNKANVLRQLRGEDTGELALPPVDELDLGAGEIY